MHIHSTARTLQSAWLERKNAVRSVRSCSRLRKSGKIADKYSGVRSSSGHSGQRFCAPDKSSGVSVQRSGQALQSVRAALRTVRSGCLEQCADTPDSVFVLRTGARVGRVWGAHAGAGSGFRIRFGFLRGAGGPPRGTVVAAVAPKQVLWCGGRVPPHALSFVWGSSSPPRAQLCVGVEWPPVQLLRLC